MADGVRRSARTRRTTTRRPSAPARRARAPAAGSPSPGRAAPSWRSRMRLLVARRDAPRRRSTPPRPGSASSRGRCTPHCAQASIGCGAFGRRGRRRRAAARRAGVRRAAARAARTTAIRKSRIFISQASGGAMQHDLEHEARADVGEQQQARRRRRASASPAGPRQPKARRPASRPAKTSQPSIENTVLWSQRQRLANTAPSTIAAESTTKPAATKRKVSRSRRSSGTPCAGAAPRRAVRAASAARRG